MLVDIDGRATWSLGRVRSPWESTWAPNGHAACRGRPWIRIAVASSAIPYSASETRRAVHSYPSCPVRRSALPLRSVDANATWTRPHSTGRRTLPIFVPQAHRCPSIQRLLSLLDRCRLPHRDDLTMDEFGSSSRHTVGWPSIAMNRTAGTRRATAEARVDDDGHASDEERPSKKRRHDANRRPRPANAQCLAPRERSCWFNLNDIRTLQSLDPIERDTQPTTTWKTTTEPRRCHTLRPPSPSTIWITTRRVQALASNGANQLKCRWNGQYGMYEAGSKRRDGAYTPMRKPNRRGHRYGIPSKREGPQAEFLPINAKPSRSARLACQPDMPALMGGDGGEGRRRMLDASSQPHWKFMDDDDDNNQVSPVPHLLPSSGTSPDALCQVLPSTSVPAAVNIASRYDVRPVGGAWALWAVWGGGNGCEQNAAQVGTLPSKLLSTSRLLAPTASSLAEAYRSSAVASSSNLKAAPHLALQSHRTPRIQRVATNGVASRSSAASGHSGLAPRVSSGGGRHDLSVIIPARSSLSSSPDSSTESTPWSSSVELFLGLSTCARRQRV
ncbi:hypothetical protein BJ912DRAFT_1144057 [Pholiota molesta]|nr:hypothetical protein BJ912DRAFT_1144057 [Pholiota molesta]